MTFGEKLMELRREKGYSQEQLASLLGVTRQSVSKWEAGGAMPEIAKLTALADTFQVSVDYLLREDVTQRLPHKQAAPDAQMQTEIDVIKKYLGSQLIYEYKSKTRLMGLPLVHIKFARNGFAVAKGVIAVGNLSVGVISVGAVSCGLLSLGAISGGLLALGGMAVGAVAVGGLSVGLLALGGCAWGVFALGGIAVAKELAVGGAAIGKVAVGDAVNGRYTLLLDENGWSQVSAFIAQHYPTLGKLFFS